MEFRSPELNSKMIKVNFSRQTTRDLFNKRLTVYPSPFNTCTMKKTLLINFILLFVVFAQAQVKPKVAAQPAKPSKQVTLDYIKEKLTNCAEL